MSLAVMANWVSRFHRGFDVADGVRADLNVLFPSVTLTLVRGVLQRARRRSVTRLFAPTSVTFNERVNKVYI